MEGDGEAVEEADLADNERDRGLPARDEANVGSSRDVLLGIVWCVDSQLNLGERHLGNLAADADEDLVRAGGQVDAWMVGHPCRRQDDLGACVDQCPARLLWLGANRKPRRR